MPSRSACARAERNRRARLALLDALERAGAASLEAALAACRIGDVETLATFSLPQLEEVLRAQLGVRFSLSRR